jgi:phospholipase C
MRRSVTVPPEIEHLVVLMMENRSFDHLLGFLDHPYPDRFPGLKGTESIGDHRVSSTAYYSIPSPDHSHAGVMRQIYGGENPAPTWKPSPPWPKKDTNRGFIHDYTRHCGAGNKPESVMRCFHPKLVPVVSGLARNFAVCTRWFSSVPGETWPNRDFAVAARSFGRANQHYWVRDTTDTVFHRLQDAGASWRIYHDAIAHTYLYDRLYGQGGFKPLSQFFEDVEKDELPRYSFIEPDYGIGYNQWYARWSGFSKIWGDTRGNSHHPGQAHSMAEFIAGENLIAGIYNALAKTMKKHPGKEEDSLFARTLFVITYDEHGGFFDRESPPDAVQPMPDEVTEDGFQFDVLGARVPAILISPWIEKGTVIDTQFDHSSIPATVRKLFARDTRPLTRRDEAANTFDGVLTDTLRTPDPNSAEPIYGMKALDRDLAEEMAEKYAASPNPADKANDAEFRKDWLWLAEKAQQLKGGNLTPPPPVTRGDADAVRAEQDEFARKVVEMMYD